MFGRFLLLVSSSLSSSSSYIGSWVQWVQKNIELNSTTCLIVYVPVPLDMATMAVVKQHCRPTRCTKKSGRRLRWVKLVNAHVVTKPCTQTIGSVLSEKWQWDIQQQRGKTVPVVQYPRAEYHRHTAEVTCCGLVCPVTGKRIGPKKFLSASCCRPSIKNLRP